MTDQNTGNTLAEVRLEFTVSEPEPEPEPNPGLSVTDSLEFGTKEEGYKELPDAKKVTVTNTGNTKIVLKQPSSNAYTIGTLSATELEAGDNATFSVQPVSVRRRITLQASKSHPISKIYPMEPRKPRKP